MLKSNSLKLWFWCDLFDLFSGLPEDKTAALELFQQALENGNPGAKEEICRLNSLLLNRKLGEMCGISLGFSFSLDMNSMKLIIPLHFISLKKDSQTMLWHLNARVNSRQRWKQTRFRVCFHLWCELTSTMNVTEWQVSWNSWNVPFEVMSDDVTIPHQLSPPFQERRRHIAWAIKCISTWGPRA